MAIERTLTAEQFKDVPESDRSLYRQEGDSYQLVDPGPLARAHERVKAERTSLATERDELKKRIQELTAKQSEAKVAEQVSTGDAKKVDDEWQAKYTKDTKSLEDKLTAVQKTLADQHTARVIDKLAGELALPEFVEAFKPSLEKRVGTELGSDNVPKTVVYDSDGKATKDTLADLTKELKSDSRFKKMLQEKAVGSGTSSSTDEQQPVNEPTHMVSDQQGQLNQQFSDYGGRSGVDPNFSKFQRFMHTQDPREMEAILGPLPN